MKNYLIANSLSSFLYYTIYGVQKKEKPSVGCIIVIFGKSANAGTSKHNNITIVKINVKQHLFPIFSSFPLLKKQSQKKKKPGYAGLKLLRHFNNNFDSGFDFILNIHITKSGNTN